MLRSDLKAKESAYLAEKFAHSKAETERQTLLTELDGVQKAMAEATREACSVQAEVDRMSSVVAKADQVFLKPSPPPSTPPPQHTHTPLVFLTTLSFAFSLCWRGRNSVLGEPTASSPHLSLLDVLEWFGQSFAGSSATPTLSPRMGR